MVYVDVRFLLSTRLRYVERFLKGLLKAPFHFAFGWIDGGKEVKKKNHIFKSFYAWVESEILENALPITLIAEHTQLKVQNWRLRQPRGLQPLSDLSTPGLGPHYILYVATSLRDWRGKEEEEKGQMSKQPFPSCSSPTILWPPNEGLAFSLPAAVLLSSSKASADLRL